MAADPHPRRDVRVAIVMGSQSDWATMRHATATLDELGVAHEARIVSAHRTPDRLVAFAKGAKAAGLQVIIMGVQRVQVRRTGGGHIGLLQGMSSGIVHLSFDMGGKLRAD